MPQLWLLVILLGLNGCGFRSGEHRGDPLAEDIPIGAVWSLSGAAAPYGMLQRNAAELAVAELEATKFLGTAHLRLIVLDDRSSQEGAIAAFDRLLYEEEVVAILGPTLSHSAIAASPLAQEKGVVVLAVSNTATGIVEMGPYVFRNSLPESVVIPHTISVTHRAFQYQTAAILYGDDDAYTKSGYEAFVQALQSRGVKVLAVETFRKGDMVFAAQLARIKQLQPDVIVISALADEAVGIMVQARELGIPKTVRFIGGNGLNSPSVAQAAGPASEGAISGAAWLASADTPGNQAFVQAYRTKYGTDPDQFAAQAYTGVYLLAHAIKRAGSLEPDRVRDALAQTQNLDTVLGTFSFGPDRNPVHLPLVQMVKDGKFQLFGR